MSELRFLIAFAAIVLGAGALLAATGWWHWAARDPAMVVSHGRALRISSASGVALLGVGTALGEAAPVWARGPLALVAVWATVVVVREVRKTRAGR